ncbi:hypothetical protein TNCV_675871 [Trichonephila clavipes]|nr:hypothetical protein TNCV_675871 [Trichonephila clavipes]
MNTKLAWELKHWGSCFRLTTRSGHLLMTSTPNGHIYWDGYSRPWPSGAVAPLSLNSSYMEPLGMPRATTGSMEHGLKITVLRVP